MIVAYTFGGGRDVFKAGIFFQERSVEKDWLLIRVLQTMTQTFSMKVGHYPWFYTNNQLRWRLTFVQLVARIRCPGDFFGCLQGESLPQFDIPYGKYVRHWDTETLTQNFWIGSVARHWRQNWQHVGMFQIEHLCTTKDWHTWRIEIIHDYSWYGKYKILWDGFQA